jgi:hypothetical protein
METYVIDDYRSVGKLQFDVDDRLTPRRVTLKYKYSYNSLNTDRIILSPGT